MLLTNILKNNSYDDNDNNNNDNNYNNLVDDYKYIENVEEIKKYLVLKMNEDDNTETTIINDEEDFY